LKPAQANRPFLKKTHHKKGWWSGSRVGPEFKPQYWKKRKIEGRKQRREGGG
jgi:hypothetical protein